MKNGQLGQMKIEIYSTIQKIWIIITSIVVVDGDE